ncbi:hypothetical protein JDN41_15410 [Rhodomicrobium udaipurense]|uniref:Uncharacterized protein n=2 Tax=Rhodomicrobium udaipurense TaxID=1202716 RepID=A0A8I1GIA3_9HYPH|nr:hypothetical protein [Rhodomicrobium udaipurense]MBJ7544941.1 hypothetical protein [Rhodomicrobium udaipurense]
MSAVMVSGAPGGGAGSGEARLDRALPRRDPDGLKVSATKPKASFPKDRDYELTWWWMRLSAGIEGAGDLIADLRQALERA